MAGTPGSARARATPVGDTVSVVPDHRPLPIRPPPTASSPTAWPPTASPPTASPPTASFHGLVGTHRSTLGPRHRPPCQPPPVVTRPESVPSALRAPHRRARRRWGRHRTRAPRPRIRSVRVSGPQATGPATPGEDFRRGFPKLTSGRWVLVARSGPRRRRNGVVDGRRGLTRSVRRCSYSSRRHRGSDPMTGEGMWRHHQPGHRTPQQRVAAGGGPPPRRGHPGVGSTKTLGAAAHASPGRSATRTRRRSTPRPGLAPLARPAARRDGPSALCFECYRGLRPSPTSRAAVGFLKRAGSRRDPRSG